MRKYYAVSRMSHVTGCKSANLFRVSILITVLHLGSGFGPDFLVLVLIG